MSKQKKNVVTGVIVERDLVSRGRTRRLHGWEDTCSGRGSFDEYVEHGAREVGLEDGFYLLDLDANAFADR